VDNGSREENENKTKTQICLLVPRNLKNALDFELDFELSHGAKPGNLALPAMSVNRRPHL
jgi:hypothetical protein